MKPDILFRGLLILILESCSTVPPRLQATDKPAMPDIGSTMISEEDGAVLVYVPAGEFTMGLNAEDALFFCGKDDVSYQLALLKEEGPP